MVTANKEIKYLLTKIHQHEETIAQLLLMVAETNRQLAQLEPHAKTSSNEQKCYLRLK